MAEFNSLQGEYLLNVDGKYYNTLDISGFSQMMKLALQEATDTKKRFFSSGICCSNNLCYITSSLNVPALNFSVWFFHAAYFFL